MIRRAGTTLDRTESGVSGEAALYADNTFQTVFQSNVLPLVLWHEDGRIRDANDAYLRLTGYSRRELDDGTLRWNRLTPLEHLVRDQKAIKELHLGKVICTPFVKDYVRRDGRRNPVLLAGALLPNCKNQGIAFALDLTRYSSPESALHAQKQLLQDLFVSLLGKDRVPNVEKLLSLKSGTTLPSTPPEPGALLAHELSQPLGTILANAQSAQRLLRRSAPDLEQLKEIVTDIIAEDRRAARLIDRLRLTLKRKTAATHLLNANQLIAEVLRMLHSQFSGSEIGIELALAAELPAIRGDRLQLHQLFINLLSNACEAMNRIGPSGKKLFIRSHREGDLISIDIQDTGPGIPTEQLDTIFEPFFTTKRGGMGIGLYICRSIVQSHGGRLWAKNNPNGGATFHVSIPGAVAFLTPANQSRCG